MIRRQNAQRRRMVAEGEITQVCIGGAQPDDDVHHAGLGPTGVKLVEPTDKGGAQTGSSAGAWPGSSRCGRPGDLRLSTM
jgi:hypothetical protein